MFKRHYDNKRFGNATIYKTDELANSGPYQEVSLVTQKVAGAQKTLTKLVSDSIYDDLGSSAARFDGLRANCNTSLTSAYGGLIPNDLVSDDGTKQWTGQRTTTSEILTLNVIRTMRTSAKVRDGAKGKIDLISTTETLFSNLQDILQVQQRFVDSKMLAEAGFTGLALEGMNIFPDDYVPSGWAFGINSNYYGAAIHRDGMFVRSKWKVIPNSPEDRTMQIYLHGNFVSSLRKAHIAHSNLS